MPFRIERHHKVKVSFADNEWSPLQEVVVGRAEYSNFPSEPVSVMSNLVPRYHLDEFRPHNPFTRKIVDQAQKELDNFCQVLESHGVKVRRPELVDWRKVGGAGCTPGYTGAMPRDGLMVIGDTVFCSAFSWHVAVMRLSWLMDRC
jgi:glycine amidinotransferase